jgi:virulence factor Mce-like protein
MNLRRNASIAANPVLIGATTVLVVIVAVFLAYNANNGLPFVPSYQVNAEIPNASGLIKGNDVRMGGARIGVVSAITPLIRKDGTAGAVLHLKLDRSTPLLPRDSKLVVRPRSPLGLKYVELTAGHARATYADGATMPLPRAATRPVEVDDFFGMFDTPTRRGSSQNLLEFGNAFAGRGADLNQGLGRLEPLARHGEATARNLADPRTKLGRLFPAFEQAAREVAPVAQQQGELFAGLNATFGALDRVRGSVQDSISNGPEALDVATRELPAQAAFVRDTAELFRRFRPGFASLAHASPGLARAFGAGTPALRRSPALNARLVDTLAALEAFAADARVIPGLQRLAETARLLEPTIAFATPAQTRCNYLGLFFHNLGSALSESDSIGSFLRFGILAEPQGPNSEAGPSSAPANGPVGGGVGSLNNDSFLHSNPYPNTAGPGQTQECEAGNETYQPGHQVIGNQPGDQGLASEATHDWKAGK